MVGAVLALAAILATARTAPAFDVGPWLAGEELAAGAWRDALAAHGVTLDASFVLEAQGNVSGGERRGAAATTSTGIGLDVDLAHAGTWSGLHLRTDVIWRSGDGLSLDSIGNLFFTSEAFGYEGFRLYTVALEQFLWGDRVSLSAGRLGVGDDFATSNTYCHFVSAAFCGNPFSLAVDTPSFTSAPVASWGGVVSVTPGARWYVSAGVYDSNQALLDADDYGVDWRIRASDGVLVVGEVGWQPLPDRPGLLRAGGWYDSAGFSLLGPGRARSEHAGNEGLYLTAEQQIGPATPFIAFTLAPDQQNVMPVFVMAGVVAAGLMPGRIRDTTALGVATGTFSNDLARSDRRAGRPERSFELVLELGHRIDLSPLWRWLYVQPDVQYIVRPGGTGTIPDALVLGVQVGLTL